MRLERSNTVLVLIDLQERLMPVIHDRFALEQNAERLIRGCHVLGVPVLVTEQYVRGLGLTVEPLRSALAETCGYRPIEKTSFSALGCDAVSAQLAVLERKQVLLAGVETHVCVYQTAMELLAKGFEVSLVADSLGSRSVRNRDLALNRMHTEGAKMTSMEMALFELLGRSGTDEFRAISRLVR